ncbi:MAG TPA: hypothetical protein ENH02_07985 [Bacteroidetes bacterium]|nr:hypothetical protein [Bacteroidota bacterium]
MIAFNDLQIIFFTHLNSIKMKYLFTIAMPALLLIGFVSFQSNFNGTPDPNAPTPPQEVSKFVVPDNVKAILDNSCLPCHGADGKFKAKIKWNYDKTAGMKTSKIVGKLSKIVTKLEKGKMPPDKFQTNNPDRKLTDTDKKVIIDWARGLAKELSK